uniref:Uncharacterized protein n=1 Tax=Megaselia scalaris TaxID=36166 RepID=T1GAY3_MEGSC
MHQIRNRKGIQGNRHGHGMDNEIKNLLQNSNEEETPPRRAEVDKAIQRLKNNKSEQTMRVFR